MKAFESMLPYELENHLVLNKTRLNTFNEQKDEIEGITDARIGANNREVIYTEKKTRGLPLTLTLSQRERQSQKFEGVCFHCGKKGHMAVDCWKKRRRQEQKTKHRQRNRCVGP